MSTDLPAAGADECAVAPLDNGLRLLSPTDLAQFIMLGQCQRHLRLRLHQRRSGTGFLRRANVRAQEIPPLMTRSGSSFEYEVLEAIDRRLRLVDLRDEHAGERGVIDNGRVAELARALPPGEVVVLAQPFLQAPVGGWLLRGQADLIRLERNADGDLLALCIDIKRSTESRVEHRLQVAFYDRMLRALLDDAGVPLAMSDLGILFRGPVAPDPTMDEDERRLLDRQAADAANLLALAEGAYLDVIADPDAFRAELDRLVFDPDSLACEVVEKPFPDVPFNLGQRCDLCLFSEYCLRWTAEHDDVSLVPFLSDRDKSILRANGVSTVAELAALKEPVVDRATGAPNLNRLRPATDAEAIVERLNVSPPVGPRLDELVHRAKRLRRDAVGEGRSLSYIPSKGPSSLPASTTDLHPNLVRVYIDVQRDALTGRIYLAGSFVSAACDGAETPARQRAVIHVAGRPPEDADEAGLLIRWVRETLEAIDQLAVPQADGARSAPIHIIMWSSSEQKALLDALDRNAEDVLGATALREFLTQLAGFDSPVLSLVSEEIRVHKNYPFLCQSLQAVARYLRFDWGTFKDVFYRRMFDDRLPLDRVAHSGSRRTWYTARSRFSSAIPLEYAYAAWDELPPPRDAQDTFREYRGVTTRDLTAFQELRLRALRHVANDIKVNPDTTKTSFSLPDLGEFTDRARTLADALDEFMLIERHVELAEWRSARNAPPEQRVLAGASLLVRYFPEDQDAEVRERNEAYRVHRDEREARLAALRETNPDATRRDLGRDPDAPPSIDGQTLRLRIVVDGVGAPLADVLALSGFREGDWVLTRTRWTVDSRLPVEEQVKRAQTPKQLLYGRRGVLSRLEVDRNAAGVPVAAWLHFTPETGPGGGTMEPFAYGSSSEAFIDGELYTIEPNPNDLYGYGAWKVVQGIRDGAPNALFARLAGGGEPIAWPDAAVAGQARFLAGLDALHEAGHWHPFPPEVREYVGRRGDEPLLLVQGPPGTGKSYTTAFALFARIQGAMAAGIPFRVGAGANTHAATDVLLEKLVDVRAALGRWRRDHRDLFDRYFDPRLLDVALFRYEPKGEPVPGTETLHKKVARNEPKACDRVTEARWCVVGGTPSGLKNLGTGRTSAPGATIDCLVLDEASRMKVPEAIMAAIPLVPAGSAIVVGDHRQMQPIRKHDWDDEPRKTFQQYKVYRSVFDTVQEIAREPIRLSESHRLHEAMADFLRREIYHKDDIDYRSSRRWTIAPGDKSRPVEEFVERVLQPDVPIVVVVHDERASQLRNETERDLIAPVAAEVLARGYGLREGFGIVVPHRAQRALLQDALRGLVVGDADASEAAEDAVDTVERFQGGERDVIIVSATESDPAYLLAAGEFLYDPTRLTVALSRAKKKLVLVASRSVFGLFSPDEETFENALLWKNLLRRTCTELVWEGSVGGHGVRVWGKRVFPARTEIDAALDAAGAALFSLR